MISASHLTRTFGERVVVDDVTLTVGKGEIVALLGPNGAGKTTTMRMMAGLIRPTRGATAIDGVELTERNGLRLRRGIGFLTETPGLWNRRLADSSSRNSPDGSGSRLRGSPHAASG